MRCNDTLGEEYEVINITGVLSNLMLCLKQPVSESVLKKSWRNNISSIDRQKDYAGL